MAGFDPDDFIQQESRPSDGGFDPDAFIADHGPGFVDRAANTVLGGLSRVGQTLDRYGGAPTRTAIAALQDGASLSGAAKAFGRQFGADPRMAPQGVDIARKMGVGNAPLADTPDAVLDAANQAARMDPYSALAAGYMGAAKAIPRDQAAGMAINVAADPATYLPIGRIAEGASDLAKGALRGAGDRLWIKATGATGKQVADTFKPGSAEAIRQLGRFGDGPAQIASKAQGALDAAEASKKALVQGPLRGATVDRNAIYNAIQGEIKKLKGNESQLGLVRQLDSKLEDITGVAHENGTAVPLEKSEEIRRGYDAKAKWNSSSDADAIEANKIVANIYREAGEDAASAVNPALGAQFKADKTRQSILIPVQEAAEKRALQLRQSPHGGLLDLVALGGGGELGAHLGGPVGAAIGSGVGLAAKTLRPRYASMAASTADALSKAAPIAGSAVGPARYAAQGANYLPGQFPASPPQAAPGNPLGTAPAGANRSPSTGPDAWARQGIGKLGIPDEQAARLLADPKARDLLIQASSLTPGSKAFKAIQSQIQSRLGGPR